MTYEEIREKFLEFFKNRGHAIVPSSSLLPDDPSVLLTTAGMQQFKKYYTGEADAMKDFGSLNTASIQKSFRTSDIDEVGDETHLTFFEMLGNFSFGGYFKEGAVKYAHEFITKTMGLPISYVAVFKGSSAVPKDEESIKIWKSLDPDIKIVEQGMEDVFWGPTGNSGPCGPTTEIYVRNTAGKNVEVWNCVFNQFFYPGSREELNSNVPGKKLESLKTPGVDTGMGLERLAIVSQSVATIFETDLFLPLIRLLPPDMDIRHKRIIADHGRGIPFLLADGVRPSNKGGGYILRRLMRRVFVYEKIFNLAPGVFDSLVGETINSYGKFYPELGKNIEDIKREVKEERQKFGKTVERGIKELGKLGLVDAKSAFQLYETFGLPYEAIKEIGGEKAVKLERKDFDKEFEKHQKISRAGVEKKFGGHGLILDTGELKAANEEELKKVTRLHTATHMLQQALREVLGPEARQAGSDITVERTRLDFTFGRKLTPQEIKKVEDTVNEKIKEDLPMQKIVLPKAEAEKTGALFFFKEKYPDPVSVYFIGSNLESAWSKEFCGGPHVSHTGEIGKFKIIKEEAISAGVRRLRAVVN